MQPLPGHPTKNQSGKRTLNIWRDIKLLPKPTLNGTLTGSRGLFSADSKNEDV